jgi:hypothetical protein
MFRTIAGVILGYLVIAGLVFASLTGAYAVLGADRAFRPGTYNVSTLWIAVMFTLGLGAALAGGYVCARIARRGSAATGLAGLVLVLGLLMAATAIVGAQGGGSEPAPRTGDVSNADAMKHAQTPPWIALLNPMVGAAGVLVGARRRETETQMINAK